MSTTVHVGVAGSIKLLPFYNLLYGGYLDKDSLNDCAFWNASGIVS